MIIRETDLLIYTLAVEKKYYEFLEVYGILFEHCKCPHCGKDTSVHHKVTKEIVDTFGSMEKWSSIKVPRHQEVEETLRDITIWKGLKNCEAYSDAKSMRIKEYQARYELSQIAIYKIQERMQKIVDRYLQLKKVFNEKQDEDE